MPCSSSAVSQREASSGVRVKETNSEKQRGGGDGEAELAEELPDVAGHEGDRDEHDHVHQGDRDGRHPDLAAAVERRGPRRLAQLQVAEDVLQHHDAVVHQDADRQGQRDQRSCSSG